MAVVIKTIGAIQRKLLLPSEPGIGIIGEYLIDVLDAKILDLNETREPWFVDRAIVHTQAQRDEYRLSSPRFGKARYVYTTDDSDPNHLRRPIPIVPLEDLTGLYNSGDPASDSSLKHAAQACAVLYDQRTSSNKMVFAPVSSQAADYTAVFEPSVVRPQSAGDVAFRFEQFDAYISACTALRVLPATRWAGMSEADSRQQRADLLPFLKDEVDEWTKLFNRFKYSMINPQEFQSVPFGRDRW